MRTVAKRVMGTALAMTVVCGVAVEANAAPADSGSVWSMGAGISQITHGSDNDLYVAFTNPDGSVRKLWPNAAGVDICNGATQLRLSRTRTNYDDMVQAITAAGLAGRAMHVWYEPYQGACYIKAVGIYVK
jgi:hypothetical protein